MKPTLHYVIGTWFDDYCESCEERLHQVRLWKELNENARVVFPELGDMIGTVYRDGKACDEYVNISKVLCKIKPRAPLTQAQRRTRIFKAIAKSLAPIQLT
jgi:hypothetical protein